MDYKKTTKKAPNRGEVEVLSDTYEKGTPNLLGEGAWRQKLSNRKEMILYLKEGERYWYGHEGHGSEKRKYPA